jgi:hypothetical protein
MKRMTLVTVFITGAVSPTLENWLVKDVEEHEKVSNTFDFKILAIKTPKVK